MFGLPTWLVIVILVVAWLLFFAWILMLVARLGEWSVLAWKYPVDRVIEGTTWRWQRLRLKRFTSYNGILIVTASREGMLFRLPMFFRPGHRPFFVPWSDLTVTRTSSFLGKGATLIAARVPHVPMHISVKLAERLKKEAGEAWNETV